MQQFQRPDAGTVLLQNMLIIFIALSRYPNTPANFIIIRLKYIILYMKLNLK